MGIGKLHSLGTKPVEMRGIDVAMIATKSLDIAVAQIVCENKYNVRA